MKKLDNVKKTKELNLCISCEICSVICPENAIKFSFHKGQFLPDIDQNCTSCRKCLLICPGIDIDPFNLRNQTHITDNSFDNEADYLNVYTASSKHLKIRLNSTSGGIITDLITDLIKNKEYDSAFVLPFDNFSYKPARLKEFSEKKAIFKSAKSKYIPVSAYNLIKRLQKKEKKKHIIVATPCIVQGLINYLKIENISRDNLLFIGLFCDRTMNYNIIKYYEDVYKKKDEKILKFEFRTKENQGWPGNSKIYFDSDRELIVDKNIRKQLKEYFQLNRCLFCLNGKLNPLADISVGDCYLKEELDYSGKSNVIIRTQKGKEIFENHLRLFNFQNAEYNRIIDSQGIKNKKETLDYVKMFLEKNQIYSNFKTRREFPRELKNRLSKKQKHIKWGENYQINQIKISILIDKYLKYSILRFKLLSVSIIIILNFFKDILHSLFMKKNKIKESGANIVIIGGGLYNKGAQAMTFTTVNELKKKYPHKNIFLFSEEDFNRNPLEKDIYNFNIMPWNPEIKTIFLGLPQKLKLNILDVKNDHETVGQLKKILDKTDLFVDISGYRLSSFGAITSLDYILDIMIAKKNSARYYILPQSLGPFDYPLKYRFFLLALMKYYLKFPEKIFPRENEGVNCLKSLKLSNYTKSPDLVLTRKEKYNLNAVYTAIPPLRKISILDRAVGIIPNINVFKRMSSKDFYSMYKRLIDVNLNAGKHVYILRHSYEDLEICENIKHHFSKNENVKLIKDDLNPIELEYIIKQFDEVVASRYHSIIHCYRNYVPVFAIGWATKYYELLDDFDQLNYFIDVRDGISREDLEIKMNNLLINQEKERTMIKNKMDSIKENIFRFL